MTRPLLVIFLTIFVNLIGFGIIIPLLPFYAETFGASPLVIGLLFAVFSLCQLVAAPAARRPVGSLRPPAGADLQPARHRRQLRHARPGAYASTMLFLARIVDGLSGGNISTARAYVADVTEPKDRARAYGLIGAAFGLGFIFGPALSGVLAKVSYTAPIWAAAALTLVATAVAWFWLPETVHRAQAGTGTAVPQSAGAAAAAAARPRAGHRFRVLVRVRDVPDDVRAVHRAAVRLRRVADRLLLRRVRRARRHRAGRLDPADRQAPRRQADVHRRPGLFRSSDWSRPR